MRYERLLIPSLALIATAELSRWAFSQRTRHVIYDRAKGVSEISGKNTEPMQCAHLDHTHGTNYYNSPDNGLLLTLREHLMDHIIRGGRNGLAMEANEWAIGTLYQQVTRELGPQVAQETMAQARQIRFEGGEWPVDKFQPPEVYHQKELAFMGMNGD